MNMKMGTQASPVEIVDIADDEDVSVIYPPAPLSRNRGTHRNNAISVEEEEEEEEDHYYSHSQYEDDRAIQLAIIASLFPFPFPTTTTTTTAAAATTSHHHHHHHHNNNNKTLIDLSDEEDDVQVLESFTITPPLSTRRHKRPFAGISIHEPGESSSSNSNSNSKPNNTILTFMCEICVEPKPHTQSFTINGCTHSYCSDCMIKYVASKLQDNITQIRCPVPDCKGLLEPEHCRSILPPEVFDRWGTALCEAVILASEKFYCPFKDCSALLIDDRGGEDEVITQSECPDCRRLFCVQCKVPWHPGIECAEFQKLNKDEREREDILLMNLAKNNKWIRCPKCRFYVEKSEGCLFMKCRCGYTFCYNCGAPLKEHYCSRCKR